MQTPRTKIIDALSHMPGCPGMRIKGWVRTIRDNKRILFLQVNDGSCLTNLQVVCPETLGNFETLRGLTTGSSVEIVGTLLPSPAAGQKVELRADEVKIIGLADPSFPMQKKRHSFEYLRTQAHLRVRTNTFGAVMRVRSTLAQVVHQFFQQRRFFYMHTPIITSSDCEGAGEMFRVTTFDFDKTDGSSIPRGHWMEVDYHQDFFGRAAYLTVSGQLGGEAMAMGLSDIYTFGPTFRAENSNTARHAAEFWMIEPEMAWADLDDDVNLAEAFIKHLLAAALVRCEEDLAFLSDRGDKGLVARLQHVLDTNFERMTYTEAIHQLEQSGQKFEFPVFWGANLQAEHERYLTETLVGRPVFVTDYPKEIKAFYMRRNDDGKTVAAMDLLVHGIGELIGGSQREERLDVLEGIIARLPLHVKPDAYEWYLDTRRFGTVPHAGFGLGFERLVMYVTGMENIRDVIPFPRTPRNCGF